MQTVAQREAATLKKDRVVRALDEHQVHQEINRVNTKE